MKSVLLFSKEFHYKNYFNLYKILKTTNGDFLY